VEPAPAREEPASSSTGNSGEKPGS
jgi:hypothetical protein